MESLVGELLKFERFLCFITGCLYLFRLICAPLHYFMGPKVNDQTNSPVVLKFEMFDLREIRTCNFIKDKHLVLFSSTCLTKPLLTRPNPLGLVERFLKVKDDPF